MIINRKIENLEQNFDDNKNYVDIFKNFNEYLVRTKEYLKLSKKMKISRDNCLDNYKHTTFVITNLEDYIKISIMLQGIARSGGLESSQMIYRGQSNYEWNLVPSLWRLDNSDENTEHLLVSEFISKNPNEFKEIISDFDMLAKMQHYGLPTRLLDFTTNPLVALYFACEDKSKNTARIVARMYNEKDNGNVVDAICGSWKIQNVDNVRVDELLKNNNVPIRKFFHYLFGYEGAILFKRPKYWNQRLKNQSAMFMIYPDTIYDWWGERLRYIQGGWIELKDKNTDEMFNYLSKYESKFSDCTQTKESIYRKDNVLDVKNWLRLVDCYLCNRKNLLYDDMASYFKYGIDDGLSDIGKKVLLNRFSLEYNENTLDKNVIETQFCSILIPSKYKSKILSELAIIGIDLGFIYPELEYCAKNIKSKYVL